LNVLGELLFFFLLVVTGLVEGYSVSPFIPVLGISGVTLDLLLSQLNLFYVRSILHFFTRLWSAGQSALIPPLLSVRYRTNRFYPSFPFLSPKLDHIPFRIYFCGKSVKLTGLHSSFFTLFVSELFLEEYSPPYFASVFFACRVRVLSVLF